VYEASFKEFCITLQLEGTAGQLPELTSSTRLGDRLVVWINYYYV
jgi:hypothetical protein